MAYKWGAYGRSLLVLLVALSVLLGRLLEKVLKSVHTDTRVSWKRIYEHGIGDGQSDAHALAGQSIRVLMYASFVPGVCGYSHLVHVW